MSSVVLNSPTEIQRCLEQADAYEEAFHALGKAIIHRSQCPGDASLDLCNLADLYSELQDGIEIAKEKYHVQTKG
jgi:hypothetical protein